jgi:4-amino-4-deoxy-L-arabinose transferase-like glycosyltransferase
MSEKEKTEPKEENKIASRKEKITDKVKLWFKNPYNSALFAILLIAFAIRLFYFFMVKMQPIWPDEAEYMVQAKRWAFGADWYWKWSVRKPVLLSFLSSLLFRVGFNEMSIRFLMLLTSVIAVYLTYVVATDFWDKKVGLIAAFLISTWWVHLFFTLRLLTWLPSATLLLASLHFFYRGYIKKQGSRFMWLFGIFFSLGFLMRVSAGIMIVPFFIYVLLDEKFKFVINKNLWTALFFMFLVISPFLIWLFINYPQDPIGQFLGVKYGRFSVGQEHGSMGFKGIPAYFKDIPNILISPFSIFSLLFLFGLIYVLADLLLGFDLIFKKEYPRLRFYILAITWILLPLVVFGFSRSYVEQRDAIVFSVFMFSIIGLGITKLYELIKKYNRVIAFILVISLLMLGTYSQLTYGYNLIRLKKDSYLPVRDASLWISQQANKQDDTIISKALPQVTYYSELSAKDIPEKEEDMLKTILENNAKYFINSNFEPYWLIPEWSFTWGQRNPEFAKPVWAWFDNPEQPRQFVVVYELNRTAIKDYLYKPSFNKSNMTA